MGLQPSLVVLQRHGEQELRLPVELLGTVAFIDNVSYAWHCSVTGIADATGCAQFNDTYVKKPLCKNNSTIVYTAQCKVTT